MTDERLQPLDEEWQTALAVVAHPDDLEYGTASAVSKWTSEGKRVVYLLATRGEAGIDGMDPEETSRVRTREEIESAAVVGVDTVEFLDHLDGVVEYGLPLRRDIARAIRVHRPEVVITLNFEMRFGGGMTNQADHRAVGLAALDASKDATEPVVSTEPVRSVSVRRIRSILRWWISEPVVSTGRGDHWLRVDLDKPDRPVIARIPHGPGYPNDRRHVVVVRRGGEPRDRVKIAHGNVTYIVGPFAVWDESGNELSVPDEMRPSVRRARRNMRRQARRRRTGPPWLRDRVITQKDLDRRAGR